MNLHRLLRSKVGFQLIPAALSSSSMSDEESSKKSHDFILEQED
jgi:hypothetical protein